MSGIPAWAVRGSKVVCIDKPWKDPPYPDETYPSTGGVYTVRRTIIEPEGVFLLLVEVRNPITHLLSSRGLIYDEICFGVNHFRPLVSNKTEEEDVALFRDLIRQPVRESERA